MTRFRTLDDLGDVRGRRVLVRVDYNLPISGGKVGDATRIERSLATIKDLKVRGARIILLSHMGRPKGTPNPAYSLQQILSAAEDRIGPVSFTPDCIGSAAVDAAHALNDGDVLLLENLRFHKGEEANDPAFAKSLAASGEIFVNDAFSAAHRAHASTVGLAEILPAYAGRAMEAELSALSQALDNPVRPVMAFVGGAKISTKLDLLENITSQVDILVIGGAMANTFLAAQGSPVGKSLCEHELGGTARSILEQAKERKCEILLPGDVVVAAEFKAGAPCRTIPVGQAQSDDMILDIGAASVATIVERLSGVKTVVWNGPLGAFEIPPFDEGTVTAARAVANATKVNGLISVAGGGDTVAALNHAGVGADFTYISTAGGAFLEWLEGKDLPGVSALTPKT